MNGFIQGGVVLSVDSLAMVGVEDIDVVVMNLVGYFSCRDFLETLNSKFSRRTTNYKTGSAQLPSINV